MDKLPSSIENLGTEDEPKYQSSKQERMVVVARFIDYCITNHILTYEDAYCGMASGIRHHYINNNGQFFQPGAFHSRSAFLQSMELQLTKGCDILHDTKAMWYPDQLTAVPVKHPNYKEYLAYAKSIIPSKKKKKQKGMKTK
jgi:hypothetical protein